MQPEEGMVMGGELKPIQSEASLSKRPKLELNPLTLGGLIVGVVAVILIIVTIVNMLNANPYGPETRIDNFSQYYKGVSRDRQSAVFAALHTVIAENVVDGTEVPSAGALVRGETAEYEFDEATQVYYGKFVVDIEKVEQSYWAQFEWSPIEDNPNLGGYSVLMLCVSKNLRIYENNAGCQDITSGNVNWEHSYQWDYILGGQSSWKIRDVLRELIIEDDPLASYVVTIDEASLKRLNMGNEIGYQSEVVVDGTERYRVMIRTDETNSTNYIAVYVSGVDSDTAKGYVLIDEQMSEDERVKMKDTLKNWLISVSGRANLEIEYRTEKLAV